MVTKTTTGSTMFDRELAWVISIFAVVWMLFGGVAYYVLPAVACLNFNVTDLRPVCTQALELSLLPAPYKSDARRKLIEAHMQFSETDKALDVIAAEEKLEGGSVWLFTQKAYALQQLGRTEEVAKAYQDVLRIDPNDESTVASLIGIEIGRNAYENARKVATDFLKNNPKSAVITSWQGWVEHRAGNHALALSIYDKAIALSPDDASLYRDLVDIKLALNDETGAIDAITEAIQRTTDDASSYLEKRAEIFDAMGDLKLSQADYESALTYNRNATTLVALGRSYTDSADFDKALPLFNEALTQDYEVEWVYDSKIRMLVHQGNFSEAKSVIAELRKVNAESVDAKFWAASIDYEQDRFDAALAGYKSLLQDAPYYTDAMIEMGHTLIELKRPQESIPYFTDAIGNRPQSAYAYASRARAHLHMENWWATLSDANQAIKLKGKKATVYAHRGLALARLGRLDEAKTSLQRATEIDPKVEWVQRDTLSFLIDNNFLTEAGDVLQRHRTEVPQSKLVEEFEAKLRERGVNVP